MATCAHIDAAKDATASTKGCAECEPIGQAWVSLRMCLTCGHVGCCDSSIGKHATAHYHGTSHPVMRSVEPGQNWKWCYVDEVMAN